MGKLQRFYYLPQWLNANKKKGSNCFVIEEEKINSFAHISAVIEGKSREMERCIFSDTEYILWIIASFHENLICLHRNQNNVKDMFEKFSETLFLLLHIHMYNVRYHFKISVNATEPSVRPKHLKHQVNVWFYLMF